MNSGVYAIRNMVNGNVYIGSTKDFHQRKRDHFKLLRKGSHPCRHLQAAFSKYGDGDFVFSVILRCNITELILVEQWCIDARVATTGRDSLYNASLRADRAEWSRESRHLSRIAKLGERNPFFGKTHTDEQRAKFSRERKGRKAWNKGVPATPECRRKISEAGSGRLQSPETRAKRRVTQLRNVALGKLWGPQHRAAHRHGQIHRRVRELLRTDL